MLCKRPAVPPPSLPQGTTEMAMEWPVSNALTHPAGRMGRDRTRQGRGGQGSHGLGAQGGGDRTDYLNLEVNDG